MAGVPPQQHVMTVVCDKLSHVFGDVYKATDAILDKLDGIKMRTKDAQGHLADGEENKPYPYREELDNPTDNDRESPLRAMLDLANAPFDLKDELYARLNVVNPKDVCFWAVTMRNFENRKTPGVKMNSVERRIFAAFMRYKFRNYEVYDEAGLDWNALSSGALAPLIHDPMDASLIGIGEQWPNADVDEVLEDFGNFTVHTGLRI